MLYPFGYVAAYSTRQGSRICKEGILGRRYLPVICARHEERFVVRSGLLEGRDCREEKLGK
jgi:hypothetical protein